LETIPLMKNWKASRRNRWVGPCWGGKRENAMQGASRWKKCLGAGPFASAEGAKKVAGGVSGPKEKKLNAEQKDAR